MKWSVKYCLQTAPDGRLASAWSVAALARPIRIEHAISEPSRWPGAGLDQMGPHRFRGRAGALLLGQAQHWLSPGLYLVVWMVGLAVAFFVPTHFILRRVRGAANRCVITAGRAPG